MAGERRRLAAVVFADIVGYSRLMEADETGTLLAIERIRKKCIDPGLAGSGGRLVNTGGDSYLFEFPSSAIAVSFAIELQTLLAVENEQVAADRQIQLRVGINVADIPDGDGDINANGVNVAARLQEICHPGGVCISNSVYELIRGIVRPITFSDGGEVQLKNLTQRIRVWHWSDGEIASNDAVSVDTGLTDRRRAESRGVAPIDARLLLSRHKQELLDEAKHRPFIVFLCGPTLNDKSKPSAALRARLKEALEADSFEVVLGEDDGLEDGRLALNLNAQDNELEFISASCNAVVVIADSVGSFCELGLFSWHFVHDGGRLHGTQARTEFILLVDEKYKDVKSYLNEGPARAVNGFGVVHYVNFDTFDCTLLLNRIRDRRGTMIVDRRIRRRASEK